VILGSSARKPSDGKGWFADDYLHFVVQAPFVKGDKVDLAG
jgi:hypothetical protein